MARTRSSAERSAAFLANMAALAFDLQSATSPEDVARRRLSAALRGYAHGGRVTTVDSLVPVIGMTAESLPYAARLLIGGAIAEAVIAWLPEENKAMRLTAIAAFPLVEAKLAELLRKQHLTAKEVIDAIKPAFLTKFQEITNTIAPGGHVADPTPSSSKAAPAANYVTKRGKLSVAAGVVIDRLIAAGGPRSAIIEEVTHASTESVNGLVAHWSPDEIVTLTELDDAAFLANGRVKELITTFTESHAQRHPKAAPAADYINKRALLAEPVGNIIDRLLELAEMGSRKGKDPNPAVEGVAAMLRTAITEEVAIEETESVNKLVAPWGDPLITHLLAADNPTFLGNERVARLTATFVASYHQRHPGKVTAETEDGMDTFFDNFGIPPKIRGHLVKLFSLESLENATDKVEDFGYPLALNGLRLGFVLPVGGAAVILSAAVVLTLGVQTVFLNDYSAAWESLSGFELARRGLGFGLNALYQLVVPAAFLAVAIFVGFPFLGTRPTKPAPLPWHLKKRSGETDEVFAERLRLAQIGTLPDLRMAAEVRFSDAKELYEKRDDDWRRAFRTSLAVRGAVVFATVVIGTIMTVTAGMVVSIPTFQWLTTVIYLVFGVIGFHIMWLADDVANIVRKFTFGGDEHAKDGEEDEHAASNPYVIKRVRKICGTGMLVVAAAAFTHMVAIHLAPWSWAMATLVPTYLLLGLAVFLVSRILFGDSEDAPHDVREDSGTQRRFVHKWVSGACGAAGAVWFVGSMALSVAVHGYGWHQDCKGFEGTYECRVVSEDGYAQYVDSPERWEVLRDRSAEALPKRKHPKPVGDACVIATKAVDSINIKYRTSTLSGAADGLDEDVCSILASDGGVRTRFPDWSRECAKKRVACDLAKR